MRMDAAESRTLNTADSANVPYGDPPPSRLPLKAVDVIPYPQETPQVVKGFAEGVKKLGEIPEWLAEYGIHTASNHRVALRNVLEIRTAHQR